MKIFSAPALAVGILAFITGCDSHFTNGWSAADLNAVTNVIQAAEIPIGLKTLEVDNRFGMVRIIGTDSGIPGWTWKLAVHAKNDSVAQQIASASSCKAELDGDKLKLVVSLPDTKEPHSIQSDFQISVPKLAAVRTHNRFGPTEITDLVGNVEATGQNGSLEIRNIGANVRAQTAFNSLSVSNTGPATLKNQNGEILAVSIGGPLEATTSFASLITKEIRGQATLRNPNGRIEATGVAGRLDAKTSFNSLVARDIGGPVHLRDQNGSIKIVQVRGDADAETSFDGLNVEGVEGNAILMNQNGSVIASGVTGSVNASSSFASMNITGGGSKFVCHNQNGAIQICATSVALVNIEAKTSFAPLEVHLPAALKPAIQARTSFAKVESDFPMLIKSQGIDPFAEIAAGTARITLQNQNGSIGVVRD